MSVWPQVVTGLCTVAGALVGGGMVSHANWNLAAVARESDHKRELRAIFADLSMAMTTYLDTVEVATLMMAKLTEDEILNWTSTDDAQRMTEQRTAVIRPLTQLKVESGVYRFHRELDQLVELWDQISDDVFSHVREASPRGHVVEAVNHGTAHLNAIRRAMRDLEGVATLELSVNAPDLGRRTLREWWDSRVWAFWR